MSDVKYRTVTISSMLDTYKGGSKRSTFVSAVVDLGDVSVEKFRIEQLKIGLEVAVAAVQNALCRQELTEDEARTRIQEMKENYNGFIERLESKASKTNEEPAMPF